MKSALIVLSGVLIMAASVGCDKNKQAEGISQVEGAVEAQSARAILKTRAGMEVKGTVFLTEVEDGIRVQADVSGLSPGNHGFHIHEIGDCSAADFTSAGDHFAPDNNPHGPPGPTSHAGDFGNLEANADGVARLDMVSQDISLDRGAEDSVLGRAFIVHADPDDLTTQPSGNAGDRIACGVIQAEEAAED